MKTMKTILGSFALVLATLSFSLPAHAITPNLGKKHPRRAEVLRRDQRIKNRTAAAENSGKITDAQGDKLEKEENHIKNQKQKEAKANGGFITKAEKRRLNRKENRVNRQMRRDMHRDAAKSTSPGTN